MLSEHLKTKGRNSAGYQLLASASQMLVGNADSQEAVQIAPPLPGEGSHACLSHFFPPHAVPQATILNPGLLTLGRKTMSCCAPMGHGLK